MGIDRIGKGAPPVPPASPHVDGGEGTASVERPFAEVLAPVEPTQRARPVGPLERLRAGEIDLQAYVDLTIEEATAHLPPLPPEELEAIKATLRDRVTGDPALVELVRKATETRSRG